MWSLISIPATRLASRRGGWRAEINLEIYVALARGRGAGHQQVERPPRLRRVRYLFMRLRLYPSFICMPRRAGAPRSRLERDCERALVPVCTVSVY